MKDFPSCFGESGVQVADASSSSSSSSSSAAASKHAQNVVTCIYKCRLLQCRSCLITITWAKNLMGQTLGISIDDLCKVDIKPWLFAKRKGSRTLTLNDSTDRVSIHWDLTNAKFGSRPEPMEGFFVAVIFNEEILLLIGDMKKEAYRRIDTDPTPSSNSVFVSKRENLFGKSFYVAKAQFFDQGKVHDISIECDYSVGGMIDPCLVIRIDNKMVMQVRRLKWKFRGNYTIHVDGIPVEVYWDVHNWLFGTNGAGNAVFMFQSCKSVVSSEKLWSSNAKVVDSDSWLDSGFSMIFYAWKSG